MTKNLKMDVQARLNDLEDAWFDRADAESLRRIEARVRSRRALDLAQCALVNARQLHHAAAVRSRRNPTQ